VGVAIPARAGVADAVVVLRPEPAARWSILDWLYRSVTGSRAAGGVHLQALALVALSLAALAAVAVLARTIHRRYQCAAAAVAQTAAGGDDCASAGLAPHAAPTPEAPAGTAIERPPADHVDAPGLFSRLASSVSRSIEDMKRRGADPERERLIARVGRRTADATADDVAIVAEQIRRLPMPLLRWMDAEGIKVVVAHASVIEHAEFLADVGIGFAGATYDDALGIYLHDHHQIVVVARRANANTVAHEVGHAYDAIHGRPSDTDPDFHAARAADWEHLTDYTRQEGRRGREETYAHSFSYYLMGWPFMPALDAYWDCRLGGNCPPQSEAEPAADPEAVATTE
jgi:hypothetical protein